jgi:hypothetical protein
MEATVIRVHESSWLVCWFVDLRICGLVVWLFIQVSRKLENLGGDKCIASLVSYWTLMPAHVGRRHQSAGGMRI